MPKISPLYNLVDSFSREQLRAYGIEKKGKTETKDTPSRSYFIIKIPKENSQDAHFSIDQDYNMDEPGYTPIHYT